jgi:hypothetical protein
MSAEDGADLAGGSPLKMASVAAGTTMTRGTATAGAATTVTFQGHSAGQAFRARKCMDSVRFRGSSAACADRVPGAGMFGPGR